MVEPAKKTETPLKSITGEWEDPVGMDLTFADQLLVQRINDQYYLTFGRTEIPFSEANSDAPTANIKPLSRIVMPLEAMKRVRAVLDRTVDVEK